MTRVCCVLFVALALGGCKSKSKGNPSKSSSAVAEPSAASAQLAAPPVIGVTGIAVESRDPPEPREIYPQQLAKKLAGLLAKTPHFVTDPIGRDDVLRAKLHVIVEYNAGAVGDVGKVAAVVRIDVVWQDMPRWMPAKARVIADRTLTKAEIANLDGITASHVERAVLDAGKQLIEAEALRRAQPTQIIEALKAGDVARTEWALTIVAERKLTGAFSAVVPLLDSADTRVRGGAVGALVALRDPRGVDALTKRARFGDSTFLRTVIEAVSVIGGEDAVTYLEFVASGHEDEGIKKQAADALRRVKQQQGSRR